jgi:hypothetical protein
VYEVKSDDLTEKENSMMYENEDCRIRYNLWTKGGSMSFFFENKTEKDIFIDMSQTFFIKNDYASDYYMNRTFDSRSYDAISIGYNYAASKALSVSGSWWPSRYSATIATGIGAKVGATSGFSTGVSIKEPEYICIPAKSYKYVEGYKINTDYIKSCDRRIANPKETSTLGTYSKKETPLRFKNRIAYSFEEGNKSLKFIDNSFWLQSVKNYSKKAAIEKIKDETRCKGELVPTISVFKIGGPSQFYVPYQRR